MAGVVIEREEMKLVLVATGCVIVYGCARVLWSDSFFAGYVVGVVIASAVTWAGNGGIEPFTYQRGKRGI